MKHANIYTSYTIPLTLGICGVVALFVVHSTQSEVLHKAATIQPTTTIAFAGDFGVTKEAQQVLQLIANEPADALIMLGDYDYKDTPELFIDLLQSNVPNQDIAGVVGNHDKKTWSEYADFLTSQRSKNTALTCIGTVGVQETCTTDNMLFVQLGLNILGKNHLEFLEQQLQQSSASWKFCVWHYNHKSMQPGYKETKAPIKAYELCRKYGALVITGHEHSYARTHVLSDFTKPTVQSTNSHMQLLPGTSVAVVSGLGGKSVRIAKPEIALQPYWANVYTKDLNAEPGVLFCTLQNIGENPKGECYFKTITNTIIDEFSLESFL